MKLPCNTFTDCVRQSKKKIESEENSCKCSFCHTQKWKLIFNCSWKLYARREKCLNCFLAVLDVYASATITCLSILVTKCIRQICHFLFWTKKFLYISCEDVKMSIRYVCELVSIDILLFFFVFVRRLCTHFLLRTLQYKVITYVNFIHALPCNESKGKLCKTLTAIICIFSISITPHVIKGKWWWHMKY